MFVAQAKQLLRKHNTALVCADVGSAGGFHPRFTRLGEQATRIGFDADPEECKRLNANAAPGEKHVHAAIGVAGETVQINLNKKRATSSAFEFDWSRIERYPEPERYKTEGKIELKMRSLEEVCASEKLPALDYIKADVEGLELKVFDGYSKPLLAAEVEFVFQPIRKGAPLCEDVIAYFRKRGYLVADVRRTFWQPSTVFELDTYTGKGFPFIGDALFLLDPFNPANDSKFMEPQCIEKFCALLLVYGYAAEAMMTLDVLSHRTVIEKSRAAALRAEVVALCKPKMGRMPVKGVARALLLAENIARMPISARSGLYYGQWTQADREVGSWTR